MLRIWMSHLGSKSVRVLLISVYTADDSLQHGAARWGWQWGSSGSD